MRFAFADGDFKSMNGIRRECDERYKKGRMCMNGIRRVKGMFSLGSLDFTGRNEKTSPFLTILARLADAIGVLGATESMLREIFGRRWRERKNTKFDQNNDQSSYLHKERAHSSSPWYSGNDESDYRCSNRVCSYPRIPLILF